MIQSPLVSLVGLPLRNDELYNIKANMRAGTCEYQSRIVIFVAGNSATVGNSSMVDSQVVTRFET